MNLYKKTRNWKLPHQPLKLSKHRWYDGSGKQGAVAGMRGLRAQPPVWSRGSAPGSPVELPEIFEKLEPLDCIWGPQKILKWCCKGCATYGLVHQIGRFHLNFKIHKNYQINRYFQQQKIPGALPLIPIPPNRGINPSLILSPMMYWNPLSPPLPPCLLPYLPPAYIYKRIQLRTTIFNLKGWWPGHVADQENQENRKSLKNRRKTRKTVSDQEK